MRWLGFVVFGYFFHELVSNLQKILGDLASRSVLKEKDRKLQNLTKMKVFLKLNSLVQILCKSAYKQESF